MVVHEIQRNTTHGSGTRWQHQHFSNHLRSGWRGDCWWMEFFLKNLWLHIGLQPNLCLISDRYLSIESAYKNLDSDWQDPPFMHVYNIRHVTQNFMREIKDKTLRKKIMNAGYALTEHPFKHYREEIRLTNADALRWIDNIPLEKWTRAFDNGQWWGHMTTNLMESMNYVFKGIQNLPITALVRATYFRLESLFEIKRLKWSSVLQSGQLFSETSMKFVKEEVSKANTHVVTMFDYCKDWFSVDEEIDHNEGRPRGYYRVELDKCWCNCEKFQAFRMRCSHVIATCSKARQDPSNLLSATYKVTNLCTAYNNNFPVVTKEDYWHAY